MSILRDKANLVVTAKARKAGKLYAYNPQLTTGTGHPEFTVDRNCKRTEIDSEGYIRQIAPYMPAFSWVNGKPTIDTQPPSTNQYLFPFAAENSYSTKSGLSVDTNSGIFYNSPFKDSTGNVVKCGRKLVESDANAGSVSHLNYVNFSGLTDGGTYSFSTIVKTSGRNIMLTLIDSGTGHWNQYGYDFSTDSTFLTAATIEKLADGYVKLSATATLAAGSTGFYARVYLADDTHSTVYTGDGVSGVYIAGILFKEGEPVEFFNDPNDSEGVTVSTLDDINSIAVPTGTLKIVETLVDGTTNEITTIPTTYTMPIGYKIDNVIFYKEL